MLAVAGGDDHLVVAGTVQAPLQTGLQARVAQIVQDLLGLVLEPQDADLGTRLDVGGTVNLKDKQIAIRSTGDANLGILQGFMRDLRSSGQADLTADITGPLDNPVFSGQAAIAGGPNGDPANALMTVVLYLYNQAFTKFDFDYAAAVGIILFVVIFSITLVQRRVFGGAPSW